MRRSRIRRILLSGALLAAFTGCSKQPPLTAEQQQGKRIYESLCNKCHKLLDPKNYTDIQWSVAAQKYGAPLKLQTDELAKLTAYLQRANDADF